MFLLACTKFGKTHRVKGKVLNPITGQGIEGAEVRIYKNKMGLSGGSKMQKSAITDSDGNFDLSKLAFRTDKISVYSFPGEYYPIGWTQNNGLSFDMPSLKMGKTMRADFYAVPYGKLQIVIKNNNCFDVNDELSIFRTHSIQDFYSGVPNPAIYTGCVNQVGNLNKAPMGWYTYSGTVTKNGITTSISDSIYLEEDETEIWNINY